MKRSNITLALEQIAVREGITLEQVQQEIQIAIEIGMATPNPLIQERWRTISCKGEKPTPEEVIEHICNQTQQEVV